MARLRKGGGVLDRLTADVLRGIGLGFALGVLYMLAFAPAQQGGNSPLLAQELPGWHEQQSATAAAAADDANGGGGDDCSACLDSLHDCLSTRHDAAWVEDHDRLRQAENDALQRNLDNTARELRHLKRDINAKKRCAC